VVSWGYSKNGGALGHGKQTADSLPPKVVETLTVSAKFIACGHNLTAIIADDDSLWMCGHFMGLGADALPYKIPGLEGKPVLHVSCGFKYIALIADYQVFTMGKSTDGALGHGNKVEEKQQPTQVTNLQGKKMVLVECSVSEHHVHTAAVSDSGQLFTWGSGYKGKLGHGNTDDCLLPTLVKDLEQPVSIVKCGGIHSAVVTVNGECLTFGCGSDGRLGHPEQEGHRYLYKEYVPRVVQAVQHKTVTQIALSYYHTMALCANKSPT